MRSIKASEFKAKRLKLMDEVAGTGEPVVITKNGRPVAQLGPVGRRRRSIWGLHKGQDRDSVTSSSRSMSSGRRIADSARHLLPDPDRPGRPPYGPVDAGSGGCGDRSGRAGGLGNLLLGSRLAGDPRTLAHSPATRRRHELLASHRRPAARRRNLHCRSTASGLSCRSGGSVHGPVGARLVTADPDLAGVARTTRRPSLSSLCRSRRRGRRRRPGRARCGNWTGPPRPSP